MKCSVTVVVLVSESYTLNWPDGAVRVKGTTPTEDEGKLALHVVVCAGVTTGAVTVPPRTMPVVLAPVVTVKVTVMLELAVTGTIIPPVLLMLAELAGVLAMFGVTVTLPL